MRRDRKLFQVAALLAVTLRMAEGATISVSPAATNVALGNSVVVNVNIADVADLYGFQFDLTFNASVLSAVSVSEGSFLVSGGNFFSGFTDNVGGTVTFVANSLSGPVAGVTGGGLLASLTFDSVGVGTSLIFASNVILLDSVLGDIPVSEINDGSVTVESGAVPEPAAIAYISLAFGAMGLVRRYRQSTAIGR